MTSLLAFALRSPLPEWQTAMNSDEIIICHGGAKPSDLHLLSRVVAIDDEIVARLERGERHRGEFQI
jgi:hypothetical protein